MSKKTKTLVFSVISLVVLAGLLLVLTMTQQQPQTDTESTVDKTVSLINEDETLLHSISIENSYDKYSLLKEDDVWSVESSDIGTEISNVDELVNAISKLTASEVVKAEATDEDLKSFGFDSPQATATLSYGDSDSYTIVVGAESSIADFTYLMIEGDPDIYLVSDGYTTHLLNYKNYFLSKTIFSKLDEEGNSVEPDTISFTDPDKNVISLTKLDTEYEDGNYNSYNYQFDTGSEKLLNSLAYNKYLSGITNMVSTEIIATSMDNDELTNSGLDNPSYVMEFTLDGAEHKLEIGNLIDGYYMVRYNGLDIIYAMAAENLAWLGATYFDLISYNSPAPYIEQLESMVVQTPDETVTFDLDVDNIVDGGIVTYDGTELNWLDFKNYYRNINDFIGDDIVDDRELGDVLFKVTFNYADSDETLVYEYREYDSRKVAITIDGVTETYIASNYIEKMISDTTLMKNNQDVTYGW